MKKKRATKATRRTNSANGRETRAMFEERRSFDAHVGTRVRLRRMILGLSQTTLGDAIGVTFQQVQKYERGTNRISASRLQGIATLLKVKPEFFFESEAGPQPITSSAPDDYVTAFLATSEGVALANAFQKLTTGKLRRRVVALVEELANQQA